MKRIRVRRPNISHRCLVYATVGFGNKIPLPILKEVEIFGTLIQMIPIHIFGGLHDKDDATWFVERCMQHSHPVRSKT